MLCSSTTCTVIQNRSSNRNFKEEKMEIDFVLCTLFEGYICPSYQSICEDQVIIKIIYCAFTSNIGFKTGLSSGSINWLNEDTSHIVLFQVQVRSFSLSLYRIPFKSGLPPEELIANTVHRMQLMYRRHQNVCLALVSCHHQLHGISSDHTNQS